MTWLRSSYMSTATMVLTHCHNDSHDSSSDQRYEINRSPIIRYLPRGAFFFNEKLHKHFCSCKNLSCSVIDALFTFIIEDHMLDLHSC